MGMKLMLKTLVSYQLKGQRQKSRMVKNLSLEKSQENQAQKEGKCHMFEISSKLRELIPFGLSTA